MHLPSADIAHCGARYDKDDIVTKVMSAVGASSATPAVDRAGAEASL